MCVKFLYKDVFKHSDLDVLIASWTYSALLSLPSILFHFTYCFIDFSSLTYLTHNNKYLYQACFFKMHFEEWMPTHILMRFLY